MKLWGKLKGRCFYSLIMGIQDLNVINNILHFPSCHCNVFVGRFRSTQFIWLYIYKPRKQENRKRHKNTCIAFNNLGRPKNNLGFGCTPEGRTSLSEYYYLWYLANLKIWRGRWSISSMKSGDARIMVMAVVECPIPWIASFTI